MGRLTVAIVLGTLAMQGEPHAPREWQVLNEDATGYGTREFSPSPEPRPLDFYKGQAVAFDPSMGEVDPEMLPFGPFPSPPARVVRRIGAAEGLELYEAGLPCTEEAEFCDLLILAGPSVEALRPIYALEADPSLIGRIDPSEILSRHGRTFLKHSRWSRGSGYAGYREEYWLLHDGRPVNLRLVELLESAWERVVADGWEGNRYCGPLGPGWVEAPPGPPGFIPTEEGGLIYGCVVRSPWSPEKEQREPRMIRFRFLFQDDDLSYVGHDIGPEQK